MANIDVNLVTGKRKIGSFYIAAVFLLLSLSACVSIPVTYFDIATYSNLTGLKAEMTLLVESFDYRSFEDNAGRIEDAVLNFRKAYEFEKGKGAGNSDTVKQFDKIFGLFADDVKDYRESGPGAFGAVYFQEAAKVLGEAFDIAISTENLKNKGRR